MTSVARMRGWDGRGMNCFIPSRHKCRPRSHGIAQATSVWAKRIYGCVAEWLKAPVSKTGIGETQSWVQISPHPQIAFIIGLCWALYFSMVFSVQISPPFLYLSVAMLTVWVEYRNPFFWPFVSSRLLRIFYYSFNQNQNLFCISWPNLSALAWDKTPR